MDNIVDKESTDDGEDLVALVREVDETGAGCDEGGRDEGVEGGRCRAEEL